MQDRKPVLLTIKGSIEDTLDESDSIKLQTEAVSYSENGLRCLSYEESEVFGMEGTTTVIQVADDKVSVIRLGTINSIMEFEKDKRNMTLYSTPYGEVSLSILTKDIIVEGTGDDLEHVRVEYTIEIGGVTNSRNSMDVRVQQIPSDS